MMSWKQKDVLQRHGRPSLCIAQDRADTRGIEAQLVVRCGSVGEKLLDYLAAIDAGPLVISAPQKEPQVAALDPGSVERLAEAPREAIGVEAIGFE